MMSDNIILFSQSFNRPHTDSISIQGSRYYTGEDGFISFYVNVWGEVNQPGRVLVEEGADLPSILSIVGGPQNDANLKRIKIYRDLAGHSSQALYIINITDYLSSGNRKAFIAIKPNDTIIIEQKKTAYVFEKLSSVNVFMNMINLYLNIESRAK